MTVKKQLIEYNVQDIINYIVQDNDIEFDQAMNLFYNSEVFEKLEDVETGLYLESPAYIYMDFLRTNRTLGILYRMKYKSEF